MTFTDLKVYGLNSTALVASTQEAGITPMLQAAVLILTIIYTSINIYRIYVMVYLLLRRLTITGWFR